MSNRTIGILLALVGALLVAFSALIWRANNHILAIVCAALGALAILFGLIAGLSKPKKRGGRIRQSAAPEIEPLDDADARRPAAKVVHRAGRIDPEPGQEEPMRVATPVTEVTFTPEMAAVGRQPEAPSFTAPQNETPPEAPMDDFDLTAADGRGEEPDDAAEQGLEAQAAQGEELSPEPTQPEPQARQPAAAPDIGLNVTGAEAEAPAAVPAENAGPAPGAESLPAVEPAPAAEPIPAAESAPASPAVPISAPGEVAAQNEAPAQPEAAADDAAALQTLAERAEALAAQGPARPAPEEPELGVCQWAKKTLEDAGIDVRLLRFGGSAGYLSVSCVNAVLRLKPRAKKPYLLVKEGAALPDGVSTAPATKTEGTGLIRVFYGETAGLAPFAGLLAGLYRAALPAVADAVRRSDRAMQAAAEVMSHQYKL